jgi:hypothetical protein
VSERKVIDQRFGHNLTSNSIRVDLIITDFPFTRYLTGGRWCLRWCVCGPHLNLAAAASFLYRPNTTLALVMRVRSKDPMVLVTAPVPTSESGVHITQIGGDGNDGGNPKGDPDIDVGDDDLMDAFNDTDIDDDDFGDAFNDTESDLGGRAAERFGGGEPRLMPPPPPWVHQRVVIDKVGNGTITGNVQGVFDWPLLGTRPLPLSTRFALLSPNSHDTTRHDTTAHDTHTRTHNSNARAKHHRQSAGDGRGAVAGARRASAGGRAGLQRTRRRRGGAQGALARLLLLLLRGPAVVRLSLVLQPRRRQHHLMTTTVTIIFVSHLVRSNSSFL